MLVLSCAALLAVAAALATPSRSAAEVADRPPARAGPPATGLFGRHRLLFSALAAAGAWTLLPGSIRAPAAVGAAVGIWVVIDRMEPASVRERRARLERDLPPTVQLLGLVLAAGASVPQAIRQVAASFPGPAADALRTAEDRLSVGMPPDEVWTRLAAEPGLDRVARAFRRADRSGVPIAGVVQRLGEDLARERRARAADRARTVGVRAAVPLGACLLPAFLLLGIVPVVAATLARLQW